MSVSGPNFLDGIGGPKNLFSPVKMQNHRINLLYNSKKVFTALFLKYNLFVSRPTFICMTASLNCHNRKAHLDGFDSIMTEFLKISIQTKLDLRTPKFLRNIFFHWNWIHNDLIWRKVSVNKSENVAVLCRWTFKLKYVCLSLRVACINISNISNAKGRNWLR